MREVDVDELFRTVADPFVRHQVSPTGTRRGWLLGDAAVVDGTRGRHGEQNPGPVFTCLGPTADLVPLMAEVAEVAPPPWRLTVSTAADDGVPTAWQHAESHRWHWMLTATAPPEPGLHVAEVTDVTRVDEVLDLANPDSFARPGVPGIDCWLGGYDGGALVGVGALLRMSDGTGHLRGISVVPSARGQGVGTSLSAALTRRALDGGSGVATLGVFADNGPAMGIYQRLGYSVVHTFASGPVRGWA